MKKIILSCFVIGTFISHAQTEIFTDDFETTANWTHSAQTGAGNGFVINDTYVGGTFTFFGTTYVIPDVPSQPVTFSNPDMNYLHPVNLIATSNGVNNSSYVAGGSEILESTYNIDISTVGYENIEISFWRTGGANGLELIYSEDGGATWTPAVIVMTVNPTTWEEVTYSFPASVENISNFRIGFRLTEANLTDPAPNHYHSIDEVTITGDATGPVEELTASVQNPPAYYCGEEDITVDYSGNGTYNAANEFQLELSDDAGDFTSATTIGSVASTNATGTITGTIPMGITSGTGYRVRVVSTDNAFTGDDNGTDLTLHPKPAAPVITQNGLDLQSDYANGNQWYLDGAPIAGAVNQDLTADESGDYTVVHTSAEGCESDPSNPIAIDFTSTLNEVQAPVQIFPNPFENSLNVQNTNGFNQLTVVDVTGKVIHTQSLSNSENEIITGNWESGLYFVRLTGENTSKTVKVLKR